MLSEDSIWSAIMLRRDAPLIKKRIVKGRPPGIDEKYRAGRPVSFKFHAIASYLIGRVILPQFYSSPRCSIMHKRQLTLAIISSATIVTNSADSALQETYY